MRMSDWSSDVCSSDLGRVPVPVRGRVDKSPNARTFLISGDETSTLINATFIEQRLDYGEAFKYVHGLVAKYTDADHDVYMAGPPALTGWVYEYEAQMFLIFPVTLGALILALALYMRNVVGIVTLIVTSLVAAVWRPEERRGG